jgi:hypothetical protein
MLEKIWQWWRAKRRFELYQDAYSLDQTTKEHSLLSAARRRLEMDQAVLVLAHFPSTFFRIQDLLHEASIPYAIGNQTLTASNVQEHHDQNRQSVLLLLADTIQTVEARRIAAPSFPVEINVLVAERYPLYHRDEVLETFLKQLPFSIRVGYFLSLEDPLVRAAINETLVRLMQQMGLKPGEMISSHLVSRRLNSWLKRVARQVTQELSANSPAEWLEQNLCLTLSPNTHEKNRLP